MKRRRRNYYDDQLQTKKNALDIWCDSAPILQFQKCKVRDLDVSQDKPFHHHFDTPFYKKFISQVPHECESVFLYSGPSLPSHSCGLYNSNFVNSVFVNVPAKLHEWCDKLRLVLHCDDVIKLITEYALNMNTYVNYQCYDWCRQWPNVEYTDYHYFQNKHAFRAFIRCHAANFFSVLVTKMGKYPFILNAYIDYQVALSKKPEELNLITIYKKFFKSDKRCDCLWSEMRTQKLLLCLEAMHEYLCGISNDAACFQENPNLCADFAHYIIPYEEMEDFFIPTETVKEK